MGCQSPGQAEEGTPVERWIDVGFQSPRWGEGSVDIGRWSSTGCYSQSRCAIITEHLIFLINTACDILSTTYNLIMRQHQTNTNWETVYIMAALYSLKCQGYESQRKTEKLVQIEGDPGDMRNNAWCSSELESFCKKYIIGPWRNLVGIWGLDPTISMLTSQFCCLDWSSVGECLWGAH